MTTSALSSEDRSVVVAYACTPRTGATAPESGATLTMPRGKYRVSLLRPADLSVLRTTEIESGGDGTSVPLPAFLDDLLVLVEPVR